MVIIFSILMLLFFGKILVFALKAAWSVFSILFSIVIAPLVLIGLFFAGFVYVAFFLLIIVGIFALFALV